MKNDNEYTIENEVKDLIEGTAEEKANEAEETTAPITSKSDLLKAIHERTEETPEESAPEKEEAKQPEQPKETEKAQEAPEPERRTHKQKRAEWWEKNKDRVLSKHPDPRDEKIEALQREIEELKKRDAAPTQRLTKGNFASEEDYIKHIFDQRYTELQTAANEKYQKEIEDADAQNAESERWARLTAEQFPTEEEREEYADAVSMAGKLPMTPEVARYIKESENGPSLLYYLCNNPDELVELSELSDTRRQYRLFRLESKIESERQTKHTETAKETTRREAPKATGRLSGNPTMGTSELNVDPENSTSVDRVRALLRRRNPGAIIP